MFSTYSQHFISVPFNYQSMSFERVQKHKKQGAYVLLKNNNKKKMYPVSWKSNIYKMSQIWSHLYDPTVTESKKGARIMFSNTPHSCKCKIH